MTCIVGLTEGNKVYMGGDSASVSGQDVSVSTVPKVFKYPPFVIGYTSSWRMGQILEHHISYDEMEMPKVGDSLQEFMVRVFVEEIRHAFKEFGYSKIENNEEKAGQFLVACYGHLYNIDSDYQVNENINGMDACGCGQDYALGALFATRTAGMNPVARIKLALRAAAEFSTSVRPPWWIEVTP